MINTASHAAAGLFKRPDAEEGSNAAKLQDLRSRQILRKRETKLAEMQQRLEKRVVGAVRLPSFFR
ncbi:hypothetical protein EDE05_11115 [Neorhizobium sp. R1-B]|jgi:hypothetical protein|uniref:hypothetical protein n=1 Tax=unclassified Neorhizobium TaxID=2629175 RepID=UPI001044CF8F|nr:MULTISPECIES: hypothetical protein [unclassified Neorhizobium]TCV70000.1 hypothetical protein EDE09_10915 [Neorhizobium sp. S3-V5DH]TDX80342.1 hypothetical protein EDE05_11115 [Neorhizobium sp. R1-B]